MSAAPAFRPAPAPRPGRGLSSIGTASGVTGRPGACPPPAVPGQPSWRVLRTHRRCAPEHAGQVRQLCRSDRSVLPRWHQDDRGRSDAHRGVHVAAPDGAYSRIPVWRGREHWLTWVVPTAIAMHRDILRKHGVSPDTFRAWAVVKSGYAHAGTGRRCVVRPDTLASVLDVCERTVQRCTAAAREMGLEVVVLTGRMLTFAECAHARRAGSRQRGLSTEVALTFSQVIRRIVDSVTPTRGRRLPHQTSLLTGTPDGLAAEQKGAAPPHSDNQAWPRARCRPPGWSLAAELARSVPWLAGEGPSRLAPALSRFATCERPWQAADVAAAIAGHTARIGAGPIRPETIRTRPAALLAAILRKLDPVEDHPGLGEDGFGPSTAAEATPAARPQPCGQPGCDHGWTTTVRTDGRPGVAPCPTCPPGVRSWALPPGDDPATGTADPAAAGWDPLNPPF